MPNPYLDNVILSGCDIGATVKRRKAMRLNPLRVWAVGLLLAACPLQGCLSLVDGPRLGQPPLERALVTKEDVEQSVNDERCLATNYERLPSSGEPWFVSLPGCTAVLVTAPHATNPTRDGKLRFADTGTGSLALALHRLTGVRVIYTTMASPSDPNFYNENDFKVAVAKAIADAPPTILLDLHGSHPFRPYDVDFGTMGGKSLKGRDDLLASLSEALRREGLTNQSQDYYPAEVNQTITKWAATRNIPSVQLEIGSTWLSPGSGSVEAHRYAQLLQGLARYINAHGCTKERPRRPQPVTSTCSDPQANQSTTQ